MDSRQRNKRLTPIKSIRKHCLECSGGSVKEVRECIIENCPLYPYRLGKRPKSHSTIPIDDNVKKNSDLSIGFFSNIEN